MNFSQIIDLAAVFITAVAGVGIYVAQKKFGRTFWYWATAVVLAVMAGYINVYYIWY